MPRRHDSFAWLVSESLRAVRFGFDSRFIVERFRQERQILASLEHPHIARLLDGGTTEDGSPYFVMEYIEGVAIDQYCDAHSLSVPERLQVFGQVCAAVQHAHQHLVIHRDLKAGNILVTADGTPKLLDFGIAKLLERNAGGAPIQETAAAMQLMTPESASPEQVRGGAVTMATDVYALGVLLYRLLTGQGPYRLAGDTPQALTQAICDVEPERPSAAVAQSADPGGARCRRLRGDLDTIVLKALQKEPARRYVSAERLAEDVRRHLDGLPVVARPDTLGYRTAKFVRRHRIGVAAAALVVVTLVGGIATTLWQARVAQQQRARAERRFNDVRKLANSFMFDVHDAIQNLPGSTPARKLLVAKALEYLDSLAEEAGSDVTLRQELAIAYERVGDVQGNPYRADLGDTAGALESYRKALAIRQALAAASPHDRTTRQRLADSHILMASVLDHTTRVTEALEHFQEALRLDEQLASEVPEDRDVRRALSRSHSRLCGWLPKIGRAADAIAHCVQAVSLSEALLEKPENVTTLRDLVIDHRNLSLALQADPARVAEALPHARRQVELDEMRSTIEPNNLEMRRDLSVSYGDLGRLLGRLGDTGGALVYARKALASGEIILAADPRNARAQRQVAVHLSWIADLLDQSRQWPEALEYFRRSLSITEVMMAASPANAQTRRDTAQNLSDMASVYAEMGQLSVAFEHARRSLSIRETLAAEAPADDVRFRSSVAESDKQIGDLYAVRATRAAGRGDRTAGWREARSWYQRSLDAWAPLGRRGASAAMKSRDAVAEQIAKCDAELATLKSAKAK